MGQFTTPAEVRVIVAEMQKEERAHTDKLHSENSAKFDKLFGAMNWVKGAVWTFGILLSALEIYSKFHPR